MNTPSDHDLDKAYEVFNHNHDHLRQSLMTSLPSRPEEHKRTGSVAHVRAFFGDTIMKNRVTKVAAAAVIMIAVLIGVYHFGGSFDGTSLAFGEVLEHIRHSSYAFDLIVNPQAGAAGTVKATVLEPGKMRMDISSGLGKISSIVDMTKDKSLLLFHKQKAAVMETPGTDRYREVAGILALTMKPIENLWNLRDGQEKKVGKEEIDGQSAEGFKIFQQDEFFEYEITLWAHAKTGIPILVEMVFSSLTDSSESINFTMNKFDLDVELNEELFDLEVPEGYTVAHQLGLDQLEGPARSTNEAAKVEKVLALWSEGKKTEAVDILLGIDWTKSFVFSEKSYLFTITEKDYISLKPEDGQQVMNETMATAGKVRQIVHEVVGLGQKALSTQDYEKSEKYLDAGLQLGKLLASRLDRMLIVRLVGIAAQKVTLNEMIRLYTATNDNEKLQVVSEELQTLDIEQKKIKEGLRG